MNFQAKLDTITAKNNSLVCVGLDSDIAKIPVHFQSDKTPQFTFNRAIIDATHDLVCAYKLNSAFYEAAGDRGVKQLQLTCDYFKKNHPEIPIILDAKRADISSTNQAYISYAFDYLGADAITLHPYLGREALEPFLNLKNKGLFILCRTSNPGAGEFQDLKFHGKPLWQIVAQNVAHKWNQHHNCMLVVGATYPKELAQVRHIVGNMTLLIPGIGAQGGDIKATVTAGKNSRGTGMIINSSRGIIFSQNPRFATQTLKDAINQHRHHS